MSYTYQQLMEDKKSELIKPSVVERSSNKEFQIRSKEEEFQIRSKNIRSKEEFQIRLKEELQILKFKLICKNQGCKEWTWKEYYASLQKDLNKIKSGT
jgi:hypothetical protein